MYTYKIDESNVDFSKDSKIVKTYIETILKNRGNWKEYTNKDTSLDFLFVQERYSSSYTYTLKSNLKNKLKSEEVKHIKFKDQLYQNLISKYKNKPYLLKTYYHNTDHTHLNKYKTIFNSSKVWIIKPIQGRSGIGIEVVKNMNELRDYFKNPLHGKRYVIQEYILNPLTYKRKKFHVRFYFMFYKNHVYLYTKNPVAIAVLNYKKDDFTNKDIHDTHFRESSSSYFPQDFKQLSESQKDNIMKQVKKMTLDLYGLVKTMCYKENKNCYQLFAMDVMITKELKIKLLETAINYGKVNKDKTDVGKNMKEIIQSAFIEIVDPLFPPKVEPKQKSYFMKIK